MNVHWRTSFAAAVLVVGACSSDAASGRASDALDAAASDTSTHVAATSSERSNSSSDVPDASPTSDGGTTTPSPVDASTATTWTIAPESGVETSRDDLTDASSPIEEPAISQLTWEELCGAVTGLEGRIVEVDLTNRVRRGPWLPPDGELEEPGVSRDAGDASTCGERFAPYVAPCNGSVVVLQSPALVFGEGPNLGGESVSAGCWESDCEDACLPEEVNTFGRVRARVSGVVNLAYDPTLDIYVGEVRIHGFDVRGVAVLELLELLD